MDNVMSIYYPISIENKVTFCTFQKVSWFPLTPKSVILMVILILKNSPHRNFNLMCYKHCKTY